MEKITVQNTSVMIISINKNDYISLTDIAKYKSDDPTAVCLLYTSDAADD